MGRRDYKSIICLLLSGFCMGLFCLWQMGCTDNPEAKAAKEMREQTADAVQMSVAEKNHDGAHDKLMALLQKNRSDGVTKDAALLAGGNLILVKGQQKQSDLAPQILQLRMNTNTLEKVLRSSEELLIEKERLQMLLAGEDQEVVELETLLQGGDQVEGLNKQLEEVDTQKQQVLSQKTSLEAKRDQVQGTLDEQQSQADALMRRAELEKGDARLDLEKQAFAILQQRKDEYMQAQSLENQIDILNGELALIQVRFNGLTQSAQEIQQRIQEIEASPTRTALKQQLREVEGTISSNQQSLSEISAGISAGFRACRQRSDEACTLYEEAASEFGKIRSNDVQYTATVRLADSAYQAALTCSSAVKAHRNLLERLQGLLDSTDPVFVSAMQSKLPMQSDFGAEHKDKALTFFDQSVETYEKAAGMVSRLSGNLKPEDKSIIQDAKCSLLKSELLALYGKMQLADLTEAFDLANSTETAINELVQRGSELGVCFTQSETMRVVMNDGLNYLPSIPLNMEVFVEGKKQELSAWKRLPVSEQEPAVDNGILEIDSLIAQYGQEIAGQLEPLKQEMLAAKERGFQEPELGGGFSDPNSGF